MGRILSFLAVATLTVVFTLPARAQADLTAPIAAVGAAYAGKQAVGTCLRHPVLCAATVVVGAAYIHKTTETTRKLDAETPECSEGYVALYRAVGNIERAEIAAIQRYVIIPTGISEKQFMLTLEDAKFIATFNQRSDPGSAKGAFIVSSKVCSNTLAMANRFSDVGHLVASFSPASLKFVNLDASRTGGIQEVWSTGAAQ